MLRNVAVAVILSVLSVGVSGCWSSSTEPGDAQVRSEIATSLDAANITGVQVSVIDGAVTLTGTVPDQATADRAAEIARSAKGAQSVTNQITVSSGGAAENVGGPPPPVNTPDAVLAAKVNLRLAADPALAGSKITTAGQTGGVVTLTGTVPSDAAKAAAEKTARSVQGVTNVVNELQVVAAPEQEVTVPDPQLKDQVTEVLDTQFSNLTLFVQVKSGNVTLSGAVPNRGVILQVTNAVRAIKGVKAVDTSRLTVQGGEPENERIGAPANKP